MYLIKFNFIIYLQQTFYYTNIVKKKVVLSLLYPTYVKAIGILWKTVQYRDNSISLLLMQDTRISWKGKPLFRSTRLAGLFIAHKKYWDNMDWKQWLWSLFLSHSSKY